ncbi:restriction endonuclease subunit S [Streptococcus suis]|uniref:restriction endonuclease subunit S n=1 Tax=Streptococcus suis TaxID=1307 RepID=UPI0005CCD991|nr:restriction endonuclease subunit S [Streptococcus suis]NQH92965.1 restriction endonuclease subunit S [Streptococcus suis]NQO70466.1 restriction endonuclease subunit S [Streptococcus suis]NQS18064.1 restriction endonuclease subunit S [Streptococcus suis]CYU51529.1 type I restriction-modification system%2C specificity subunit S [Streptococcus suis]HEM5717274.1 restriction endonuclease subunit S [Streptococcus suis]
MTKEKSTVPRLRFPGFTDAWKQRKLGEVAVVVMGQSPDSKNYTNNPLDNILVQGNADLKNGNVEPRVWTTQITKIAEKGDIIVSVRAPVGDVAKTSYKVVLGRGVAGIKGNDFIYQTLIRMKQFGYWMKLSTGSTFESINSGDIKSSLIPLPSLPEQEAIGNFFSDLDQLITLHQRKLDEVKELKKALLQKMFPKGNGNDFPELRFPGFTDAWKQRKLGEVLKERNESRSPSADVPLVSFTVENGVTPKTERYNREFLVRDEDKKYKFTQLDDIVYNPANLKFGAIARNKYGAAVFSPIYVTYGVLSEAHPLFVELIVTSTNFIQRALRYQEGTVYERMAVKSFDLLRSEIPLPTLPEQEVIGSFFSDLDQLITLHQRQLDHLKLLKKALLQQMFI